MKKLPSGFVTIFALAAVFLLGYAYGLHAHAKREAYACAEANNFVRRLVAACYESRGLDAPRGMSYE